MTTGCGRPAKGSHPKDDTLPCGTKLYWGTDKNTREEAVLLCLKCQVPLKDELENKLLTISRIPVL